MPKPPGRARDTGELAARDQVRRLPHHGACRRRRGAAHHPRRPRLDEALRRPAAGLRQAALPRGGDRRRDRRARRRRASAASRCCRTRWPRAPATSCIFYAFDLLHLDGWDLHEAPLIERKALLRNCSPAMRRQLGDPVLATMSRATGRRSTTRRPSSGSKASSRSAPTRPTRAAAPRPGSRPRRCRTGDFVIAGYTISAAAGGLGGAGTGRMGRRRTALSRQGRHRLRAATAADLLGAAGAAARGATRARRRAARDMREMPGCGRCCRRASTTPTARPTIRCATRVFKGLREAELSTPVVGQAQAADLRRRPRHDLGDQPDAPAVRQVRPDQARHRRLLRAGRRLHAAAHPRPAGVAGALPDRQAAGLLLPAPRLHRHAAFGRDLRERRTPRARTRSYIVGRGRQGLSGAGAVRRRRVPRLGHATARSLDKPDRIIFDLDPGEGIAWREVVEAAVHIKGELGGARARAVRQDLGRQGHAHRRADQAEARLEEGARRRPARSPPHLAATAPDTFTTTMGKDNRKRRIFIDYPPQCAQRHTRPRPIRCGPAPTCRPRRR